MTEIFNLRTKCAELAAKLFARGVDDTSGGIGGRTGLQRSGSINYNARTNRCFAEVGYVTADYTPAKGSYHRYLYDAQDNTIIATWDHVDGKETGSVNKWIGYTPITDPTAVQVAQFMKTVMDDRGE